MKTVHKRKLRDNYATIPNAILRNKSLSFKARGILCMMLSHTEEWEMTMEQLVQLGTEGREAVRSAMWEIEAAGYVTRKQMVSPDKSFDGMMWTWYDEPVPVGKRTAPPKRKSADGEPTDGFPSAGNPPTALPSEIQKNHGTEDHKKEDVALNGRTPNRTAPPTSMRIRSSIPDLNELQGMEDIDW